MRPPRWPEGVNHCVGQVGSRPAIRYDIPTLSWGYGELKTLSPRAGQLTEWIDVFKVELRCSAEGGEREEGRVRQEEECQKVARGEARKEGPSSVCLALETKRSEVWQVRRMLSREHSLLSSARQLSSIDYLCPSSPHLLATFISPSLFPSRTEMRSFPRLLPSSLLLLLLLPFPRPTTSFTLPSSPFPRRRPLSLSPAPPPSPPPPPSSYKGLRLLEWTNALISQKALVKTARTSWNMLWKILMTELAPQGKDGEYVRPTYSFTDSLGSPAFPLEEGRYHLYVGNACPWCHRLTLAHALRGLSQSQLSYSYAIDDPERASRGGWAFDTMGKGGGGEAGAPFADPVFGCRDLREVYDLCAPGYTGRCTAPVLVDVKRRRIVNNESSDLLRFLNLFPPPPGQTHPDVDLFPPSLRPRILEINAWVYPLINNGVYRCGFATSQAAYDRSVRDVFRGLERVEAILTDQRFLAGDVLTEADVRLFPTVIRFDAVYASLFKCAGKRIADYPNLTQWMREVYQIPGVRTTVDIPALIRSYFVQLFPLNPSGICPQGPTEEDLKLLERHDREERFVKAGGGGSIFATKGEEDREGGTEGT